MKNKKIMSDFLNSLIKYNKLTEFFKIIFNYKVLNDYNYISRFMNKKDSIIIDIYDNIMHNRFNRYILYYVNKEYSINIKSEGDVIVTSICINANYDINNNLMKFAYLFSKNNKDIIKYAKTFLPNDIVNILIECTKNKSIL